MGLDFMIRVLGGLAIEYHGAPHDLPAVTQRRALVFLVLHANEIVSVDQLADAVWPLDGPAKLDHAVHSLVYRLRQHLPAEPTMAARVHVDRARPGYCLCVDPLDIDANRFTEDARRARHLLADDPAAARDLLDEALGLWRGDALLDVAYDSWAAAEIRRLTETRLAACEALAEANIVLGEPELAVAELESLTERFPLRESLWALLWRGLAEAGRHLEIAASHRRSIDILADQFDLRPSPHLAELARAYAIGSSPTPDGRGVTG